MQGADNQGNSVNNTPQDAAARQPAPRSRVRQRPGQQPQQPHPHNAAATANVFETPLAAARQSDGGLAGAMVQLALQDRQEEQTETIRDAVRNGLADPIPDDASPHEVKAHLERVIGELNQRLQLARDVEIEGLTTTKNVAQRIKTHEATFEKLHNKSVAKLAKLGLETGSPDHADERTRSIKKLFSTFQAKTGESEIISRLLFNRIQKAKILKTLEGFTKELGQLETETSRDNRAGSTD